MWEKKIRRKERFKPAKSQTKRLPKCVSLVQIQKDVVGTKFSLVRAILILKPNKEKEAPVQKKTFIR